jgi:hypothetical protein
MLTLFGAAVTPLGLFDIELILLEILSKFSRNPAFFYPKKTMPYSVIDKTVTEQLR